jgi:hypothetical protein
VLHACQWHLFLDARLKVLVNNEPVMTAIGSTTAKSGSARLVVVPRHSAVRRRFSRFGFVGVAG